MIQHDKMTPAKLRRIGNLAKEETSKQLIAWQCEFHGFPRPVSEYPFGKLYCKRRWKVDLAWPEQKLIVELEGLTSSANGSMGRHREIQGFIADMAKYNAITMAGFWLLRFTHDQVQQDGTALTMIVDWFERYGNRTP